MQELVLTAHAHVQPITLIVGLAIAYSPSYVVPLMNVLRLPRRPQGERQGFDFILWYKPAAALTLMAFVVFVERRPLASIGLRYPTLRHLALVLVTVVVTDACAAVLSTAVGATGAGGPFLAGLSFRRRLLLLLTVAFSEEVIYRGYVVERLSEWTGSLVFAAAASFVIFTAIHLSFFGTKTTVTVTAVFGLSLTIVYPLTRDLPACMVLHALLDLPILSRTVLTRV